MRIVQITTDNREYFKDYDAPAPYFGTAPEALIDGLQHLPKVELHIISCLQRALKTPEKLADNVYYHSLVVPKAGWMRSLYYGCSNAVRRVVREIGPDIVHGQGTERDCAISAIRSGHRSVVTIHGNMAELSHAGHLGGLFGWLTARLETHTLKRACGVFCNSSYTQALVTPRARKIWHVPNATRRAFLERPLTPRKAAGRSPQLLNVGLITPYKRQLELLRAVRGLVREGKSCRIVFAGLMPTHTEYGRAFAAELREASETGWAEHVGYLSRDELIELMDQSDAALHAPTHEAFGLVAAEAMARGLKFFGANVGGLKDIALDADGAELYDDIPSLTRGVARWIDSGCPMPEHCARQMAERYHPDHIARRHLEIYREVLNQVS